MQFVQMDVAPVDLKTTCYFYNRIEPEGARFVAYQLADQHEVTRESVKLLADIDEMLTLTISPLEDL